MKYDFEWIKEFYKGLLPLIIKASDRDIKKWASFNHSPLVAMMSPIEKATWHALRYIGHAPMYPQYPVGRYFVDFGNPIVQVAIECDGKEFHQDKEKDRARDKELEKLGWHVYRITGSEINGTVGELRESEYQQYFSETVEGLIESISMSYFGRRELFSEDYQAAAQRCLDDKRSQY